MITRNTLLLAIIVGSSAMACTAIVLGQVGDKSDYPVGDPTVSSSSSSGTSGTSSSGTSSSSSGPQKVDPCSLRAPDRNYDNVEYPPNVCSDCIARECSDDVSYACQEDKEKGWFSTIRGCAQSPWVRYPTPESSGSTYWGCGHYDDDTIEEIGGQTDQARQAKSEICIRDKCLRNANRDCRLCDVYVKADGDNDEILLLRKDPCGQCFDQCKRDVIDCCDRQIVSIFLTKCANTLVPKHKQECQRFNDIVDGGEPQEMDPQNVNSLNREEEVTCAAKLGACWRKNCANLPACK